MKQELSWAPRTPTCTNTAPWHRAGALGGAVAVPDTTGPLLLHSWSDQSTREPLAAPLGHKRKRNWSYNQSEHLPCVMVGRCSDFALLNHLGKKMGCVGIQTSCKHTNPFFVIQPPSRIIMWFSKVSTQQRRSLMDDSQPKWKSFSEVAVWKNKDIIHNLQQITSNDLTDEGQQISSRRELFLNAIV